MPDTILNHGTLDTDPTTTASHCNVHVILTVPHARCDPHLSVRHCDRLAAQFAQLLHDHIMAVAQREPQQQQGSPKLSLACTILQGTEYRSTLDLNRSIARMTQWRQHLTNMIARLLSEKTFVILLDIHSYDNSGIGLCTQPLVPSESTSQWAYVLSIRDPPDALTNALLSHSHPTLNAHCGASAIGIYPGSSMNDIVVSASEEGVPLATMIHINESLTPDKLTLLSRVFADCVTVLAQRIIDNVCNDGITHT